MLNIIKLFVVAIFVFTYYDNVAMKFNEINAELPDNFRNKLPLELKECAIKVSKKQFKDAYNSLNALQSKCKGFFRTQFKDEVSLKNYFDSIEKAYNKGLYEKDIFTISDFVKEGMLGVLYFEYQSMLNDIYIFKNNCESFFENNSSVDLTETL